MNRWINIGWQNSHQKNRCKGKGTGSIFGVTGGHYLSSISIVGWRNGVVGGGGLASRRCVVAKRR